MKIDIIGLISAAEQVIGLVGQIRADIAAGHQHQQPDGTPYTIEQFDADVAKGRALAQQGKAIADAEIAG